MAKITPSALITAIQGKWHGSCFQMWKGAIVVRRSPIPRKISSESRFNFRGTVSSISGCFYSMTADQRIAWRCYALLLPTSVTGYNAFMARGVALEIACHSDLCIYFDAPGAYAPPMSPAPISLCYHPSNARYCVMWTNPNCASVYVQGMLSVQAMFSNEKSPKWRIFDTVPSTDLHMIFDASAFPADQMIRFTARSINMRGELSIKAEAKPPPPLPESVTLLYPIGGETLYTGSSCLIEWRSKSIDNVKLEYSTNSGVDWNLITVSVSAYLGQYAWTIPAVESSNYKVKITNTDDPTIYDESGSVFTVITIPSVTLLTPNGSEEWTEGTKHNITWNQNNATNVILKYSSDNGLSYNTITASTPAASGTYEWTVPSDLSTTCLVKILVHENQTIYDISDNTFSITESTVISSISYTSNFNFLSSQITSTNNCFLTDDTFVVAYSDSSSPHYAYVKIGTVSNKEISYSDPFTALSINCWITDIFKINNTQFALLLRTGTQTGDYALRAIIGTVDGSSISYGSPLAYPTSGCYNQSGCKLTATSFVFAAREYFDNSYGKAAIWNIDGSSLSHGTSTAFNSDVTYATNCARQDDTHFIISYRDVNSSDAGTLQLATVDGTSITFGSKKVFNAGLTDIIRCAFYDSTHFIIAYRDGSDNNYGKLKVGTIDGENITFSGSTTFNSANSTQFDIKKVTSSTLLLSYSNNVLTGDVKIITISNNVISLSNIFQYEDSYAAYNLIGIQNESQFIVSYRGATPIFLGKIKIGYDS